MLWWISPSPHHITEDLLVGEPGAIRDICLASASTSWTPTSLQDECSTRRPHSEGVRQNPYPAPSPSFLAIPGDPRSKDDSLVETLSFLLRMSEGCLHRATDTGQLLLPIAATGWRPPHNWTDWCAKLSSRHTVQATQPDRNC